MSGVNYTKVLELILEFAASGEEWEWSRNLRRVSKLWRLRSFKGLCQSTELPSLCIHSYCEKFVYLSAELEDIRRFKEHFPKTCPSKLTLTNPLLPIKLEMDRFPIPEEIWFIQGITLHIAAVELINEERNFFHYIDEKEHSIHQLRSTLQLPNLRSFFVSDSDDIHFQEVADLIRTSSKRLTRVEYNYCETLSINSLKPPSNLSHISFYGNVLDLQNLQNLTRSTSVKLSGLVITIEKKEASSAELAFDFNVINEMVQDHRKTLRVLRVRRWLVSDLSGSVEVSPLESLKILDIEVPVCFKRRENSSATAFRLRFLKYTIKYCPQNISAALEVLRRSSGSLECVSLSWNSSHNDPKYSAVNKLCEEKFLEELEQGIPHCNNLEKLRVFMLPYRLGLALMPIIYKSMTNLTSLTLHFERSPGQTRSVEEDDRDLFEILTGCDPKDIPTDELMWLNFLKRENRFSVTCLKSKQNDANIYS